MTLEEMRQHEWVVSWSGGKDSTATIILMREHNIPIKKIIYVRMMYDDEMPATLPIMTKFVDKTAEQLRAWGYDVEIVKSDKTAKQIANTIMYKSKNADRNGKPYGIVQFTRGHCKFMGEKEKAFNKKMGGYASDYQMIGYAADETQRTHRLGELKQSIMVELGITEQGAKELCERYGMLSPLYGMKGISRDGCWFCPNANKAERAMLKAEYPELWQEIRNMIAMCDYKIASLYSRNNWIKEWFDTLGFAPVLEHPKEEPKKDEGIKGQMTIEEWIGGEDGKRA